MSVLATSGSTLRAYVHKYENLALTRDDNGLPVLRFHTSGSPAVFTGQTYADFPAAREGIALDRENKALVITGPATRSSTTSTGRAWARSSSRPPGRRSASRAPTC